MVILRPTRRLRAALPTVAASRRSDTALGDWYVNRMVDRQPLLLLVSSTSLLPIVTPARDVQSLPERLGSIVGCRLRRFAIESGTIEAELQAMHPMIVAPTVDRSVLGIMVEFAKAVPYCSEDLRADQVVVPNRRAPDLLRARWLGNIPRQGGQ